jgi:hypothetical protein
VERSLRALGDLPEGDGYASLGLALIDTVFSAQANYDTRVVPLIDRVRVNLLERRIPSGEGFGVQELLDLHREIGSSHDMFSTPTEWVAQEFYGDSGVVGGHLKVAVIEETSNQLLTIHRRVPEIKRPLAYRSDFAQVVPEIKTAVLEDLKLVSGIGIALSEYLLMLVGIDGFKLDTHLVDFARESLGTDSGVFIGSEFLHKTYQRAFSTVVSHHNGKYSITQLDHLLWCFQRQDLKLKGLVPKPACFKD